MAARRLIGVTGRALWLIACAATASMAGTSQITVREGTGMGLTAPADSSRIAIELAGQIWLIGRDGGWAKPLTGEDSSFAHPTFAPDGGLLALESRIDGHDQILLLDPDGEGELRQVTFGHWHHRDPRWAPDGQRLLISSDRGGDFAIWELDVETLSMSQLTWQSYDEHDAAWNADGSRIAYVADTPSESRLYTLTPGEQPELMATSAGRLTGTAWRPDDSVISYIDRRHGIGRLRMAILSDPPVTKPMAPGERAFATAPHWVTRDRFIYAADGQIRQRDFGALAPLQIPFEATIAVRSEVRKPSAPDFDSRDKRPVRGIDGFTTGDDGLLIIAALGDLWAVSPNGDIATMLTNDTVIDQQPVAETDGDRIAFVSDRSGSPQVWLLSRSTGALTQVSTERFMASGPAWSTNGAFLTFLSATSPVADEFTLVQVNLETADRRVLARGLRQPTAPVWHVQNDLVLTAAANPPDGSRQLLMVDSLTGAMRAIDLRLPDSFALNPHGVAWAPDGASLLLLSNSRLFELDVADGILLNPRLLHVGPITAVRWPAGSDPLVLTADLSLGMIDRREGTFKPLEHSLTWQPDRPFGRTIVRAGRLFDGLTPQYLTNHEIVIDGNRIVEIRPWTTDPENTTDRIIDARRDTVMPGLIDLGVRQMPASEERYGRSWLAFGITSIRERITAPESAREQHESWRAGRRPGPRLFVQRRICPGTLDGTPGEALIDSMHRLGAGSVSGCEASSQHRETELLKAAHAAGLSFAAADAWQGIRIGADEISLSAAGNPGTGIYGDLLTGIGATGAAVPSWLAMVGLSELAARTPILDYRRYKALSPSGHRDWYRQSLTARRRDGGQSLTAARQHVGQSLFQAAGRGGRVVAASGAPSTPVGLSLHAELQLLAATGLQPFQVLKMAGLDAARVLGVSADLGSIENGKLADLIVVAGDPLSDISETANVRLTLVDGRVHDLDTLLRKD